MSSPRSESSLQRSDARLRHHYEVERELAGRLRDSSREERTALFKSIYDELFERVPDHPRLTRRETPESSRRNVERQLRLFASRLQPGTVFLEMAAGDCRLAYAAAARCRRAIAVDISDQRSAEDRSSAPENFQLVVYDGYHLDPDLEGTVDLAFSYQFLEHLHPEDVSPHFQLIHRLLRPGGTYVFDTPHRYSGPHDVSRYFGPGLDCFHFQEWTYGELTRCLREEGFPDARLIRLGREFANPLPKAGLVGLEALFAFVPKALRRRLSRRLFPSVTLAATRT